MSARTSLTGVSISGSYSQLIHVSDTDGITATDTQIYDGNGTASALGLSSAAVSVMGSNLELRFYEGSNYVGFEAGALSGDQIWVLPIADGAANELIKTDGSGTLAFQTRKELGIVTPSTATFVSGSGTAGTANTAETVVTRTLPADSLTQVGDRIRIRTWFFAQTGAGIEATTSCGPAASEVEIGDISHSGGAAFNLTESWLHYIDNTHANIIEQEGGGTVGNKSATNVAGFDWNSAQNIIVAQDAVAGNYITVFGIFVDVFPKGI